MFEVTCPRCEDVYDVADDAVDGRCPSCRLTVRLVSEEEAQRMGIPAQKPPAREAPAPPPAPKPRRRSATPRPAQEQPSAPPPTPTPAPQVAPAPPGSEFEEVPCPSCDGPLLLSADDEEGICPHCRTPLRFAPGDRGMGASLQQRPDAPDAKPALAPDAPIPAADAPIVVCRPVAAASDAATPPEPARAPAAAKAPAAEQAAEPVSADAPTEPAAAAPPPAPAPTPEPDVIAPSPPTPPTIAPAPPPAPPPAPAADPVEPRPTPPPFIITTQNAPMVLVPTQRTSAGRPEADAAPSAPVHAPKPERAIVRAAVPSPPPPAAPVHTPTRITSDTAPLVLVPMHARPEPPSVPAPAAAPPEPVASGPVAVPVRELRTHILSAAEEPRLATPPPEETFDIEIETVVRPVRPKARGNGTVLVFAEGPEARAEPVAVVTARGAKRAEAPPSPPSEPPAPITPENAPLVEVGSTPAPTPKSPRKTRPPADKGGDEDPAPRRAARKEGPVERVVDPSTPDGIPVALQGKRIKDLADAPITPCPTCTHPFRHHGRDREVQCPHCEGFFAIVTDDVPDRVATPLPPVSEAPPRAPKKRFAVTPRKKKPEPVAPTAPAREPEPEPDPEPLPIDVDLGLPEVEDVQIADTPALAPEPEAEPLVAIEPDDDLGLELEEEVIATAPAASPVPEPRPEPEPEVDALSASAPDDAIELAVEEEVLAPSAPPAPVAPEPDEESGLEIDDEPTEEAAPQVAPQPPAPESEPEEESGLELDEEPVVDTPSAPEPDEGLELDVEPEPVSDVAAASPAAPDEAGPEDADLALGPEPDGEAPALEPLGSDEDVDALPAFGVAVMDGPTDSARRRKRRR